MLCLQFSDKRTYFPKMNVVRMFCIRYKKMDWLLYLEFGSAAAFCQETPKHLLKTGLQTGFQPGSGVPLGSLPREADTLGESPGEKLAAFRSGQGGVSLPARGLQRAHSRRAAPPDPRPGLSDSGHPLTDTFLFSTGFSLGFGTEENSSC